MKVRALGLVLVLPLLAAPMAIAAPAVRNTESKPLNDEDRFAAYDDNFMLVHRMRNSGWADDDERAIRARYSFRYVFFGRSSYEAALSYTGEFDFYAGTRPSGPVVNRLSNPALRFRWAASTLFDRASERDHLELSVEHESDGQAREVTLPADVLVAQRAYDDRYRPFFDEVSRGSDFVSAAVDLDGPTIGSPVFVQAKLRAYFKQDSAVTWGPRAGSGVRLSDFHRISMRVGRDTPLGRLEFRWTIGDKGLSTDSMQLGWQGPSDWSIPLYVRVHRGPLNTLANYTQVQHSIGIGLRFRTSAYQR